MANLAEAVDATETDWIISAELSDAIDYLTVESEIVKVTANFPAQRDPQTRIMQVPRIRVERGAGGTTAASHADTTALTPLIPPASSGGGAGVPDPSGAPDGQAIITEGEAFVLETLPKDFYAQDTDPGAVGAGSVWKDTTSVPYRWWERNDLNDGWEANATSRAVAVADEEADASADAVSSGTGNAIAGLIANSEAGTGNATADAVATADDGEASAINQATAGAGGAAVVATATTDSGDATSGSSSLTTTGTAYTSLFSQRGAEAVSIELNVTDTLKQIIVTGLPTVDPGVTGQLWIDNDVLKVSSP